MFRAFGMGLLYSPSTTARRSLLALLVCYTALDAQAQLINVSAASFSAGAASPESIVSAFGSNLAASTASAGGVGLPTSLAGTTVSVTDSAGVARLARLYFVSPGQINYLIP